MQNRKSISTEEHSLQARKLIVRTWISLGRGAVTAKMLRGIQRALRQAGCEAPREISPAAIARILADEGADLRHPEVIEFDVRWRERVLKRSAPVAKTAGGLNLNSAEALLKRFERQRQELAARNDTGALRQLSDAAINEKTRAQLLARDDSLDQTVRNTQAEIAEWFRVWLQTPEIFDDWLDLRRRSHQFREVFSGKTKQG
jgi:hypothetical protein